MNISPLLAHIQKFVDFSVNDFDTVSNSFKRISVKKKENLFEEGQTCKQIYFVLKGVLRLFFVNEKGVEHTTQFALENWWMTDVMAFQNRAKTENYLQAVENAEVLVIDFNELERLLNSYHQLEKYFRIIYQRAYAAHQMRIKYIYSFTREEMYFYFAEVQPDFLRRVPQYLLASYLGLTPEYLSEIRAKRRS